MKAESDSGLLFFPSSLETGKEGDRAFLVDQKAHALDTRVVLSDGGTARAGVREREQEAELDQESRAGAEVKATETGLSAGSKD